jgi:hypothetical protein
MGMLIKDIADINGHWRRAAYELEQSLPKTGGRYKADFQNGGLSTSLICSEYASETAFHCDEFTVPVVPLVETLPGSPPNYWLGWYEEWVTPKRRAAKGKQQFKLSAILIYHGGAGSRKRQVLRAEWAGPEDYDREKGAYIFQGKHAAHPHWRLDGLPLHIENIKERWEKSIREFELPREIAVDRVKEFGSVQVEQDISGMFDAGDFPTVETADELAWARVHLASNARWSERPWAGPSFPHDMHANVPTEFAHLRGWLTSCVRYLQVELGAQLAHGRLQPPLSQVC